jgi:hypothetical protein
MHDKPLDVYGQYRFLDKTIFGTSNDRFLDRYAVREQARTGVLYVTGYKNLDELQAKVFDVAFRVDGSVLKLPPVVPSTSAGTDPSVANLTATGLSTGSVRFRVRAQVNSVWSDYCPPITVTIP